MREIAKIALLILNIMSFTIVLTGGVFSIFAEILNPPTFEKFLSKLNILWINNYFWKIFGINLVILIVTYLIRKKFLG